MKTNSQNFPPKALFGIVFISGMCSLAVEMAASRLLGNVFGSSNLVWASIIGLILIYLTIGYAIGGKWADRKPYYTTFFSILLWAGIAIVFIPVVSRPILRFSADAFDQLQLGALAGSFTSVMILMAVPMVLLGMASPFAIRLSMVDASHSGQISGQIYAISTIGSFIGTFLPNLILIPLIGTYRTFIVFGLLLLLISWIAMVYVARLKKAAPYFVFVLIAVFLLIVGARGTIKTSEGQVYEAESEYNYVQVLESDGYYMLRLNEGQGVHSVYKADQINFYGPWEQFLVGPFFNNPPYTPDRVESMAIIGLAAGTTARAATNAFGDIPIDGWEIDGKIVEAARSYFRMTEPNLQVIVQDGRWGLDQSTKKYSLIAIDAYRPPYIPAHLTTQEFFQEVSDHLTEDGAAVINVGRSTSNRDLINDLGTTMGSVFPSIYVMDLPGTFNSMIFATKQPTKQENLLQNLIELENSGSPHQLLKETISITLGNLKEVPSHTRIYTDDLSPIEWVTNQMVLQFLVSDEMDELE